MPRFNEGERYESNMCGWFTILEVVPYPKESRYLIEFDEINDVKYKTIAYSKHIRSGGIKNPYYPLKLGIACIGLVNSKEYPKEYNKWRAMIDRCYDENHIHYSNYGGRGVTVCQRWLCFEYFLDDLQNLQGYNEEQLQNGGLHLDKDIIGDKKEYSPENCILVTPSENIKEMNRQRNMFKQVKATSLTDGRQLTFENIMEFAKFCGYNIEITNQEED